jgi:transcriptional regulator with XRE-family HTH domain
LAPASFRLEFCVSPLAIRHSKARKSPLFGCGRAYLSRVETRGELPSPAMLIRLAHELGAEPEELLGRAKRLQLAALANDIERWHAQALACRSQGSEGR